MPAYDEELFGPVAAIIRVKNEEEAIRKTVYIKM
jgi:succinate-semialdehyde dehydrogenase/glutarate-semialdehyde dehydrogenase